MVQCVYTPTFFPFIFLSKNGQTVNQKRIKIICIYMNELWEYNSYFSFICIFFFSETMNIFTLPQTEEAAIHFLQLKNIPPTNKICGNGHEMKLSIGKQVRWCCAKSTCRSEIQLRVGTWLEGSRIPYVTIVRFIYAWAYE